VVILSTINRQDARRPLRSFGSTGNRKSGASVSSVVKAQMKIESVASKLSPRLFIVPFRHRVDEHLVVASMGTRGNSSGLAMRLRPERRRAHIRYPYLDRAQALRAQARSMLADLHA
jgi:hypothetical protein